VESFPTSTESSRIPYVYGKQEHEAFCLQRKEKETMSDYLENEMQPSETVNPQELRESLLAELETARQAIAELSNEQLEEVVGGGLNCFNCKPETISPPESPRALRFAWQTLEAISPSHEPRLERSQSSPAKVQDSPFQTYPTDRKLAKVGSQVKDLMKYVWKAD
jgi:hypothetical protein